MYQLVNACYLAQALKRPNILAYPSPLVVFFFAKPLACLHHHWFMYQLVNACYLAQALKRPNILLCNTM